MIFAKPMSEIRWPQSGGFTLVELLVGGVLVLIAGAGAALIISGTSNTLQSSREIDRLQALVDDDVAQIRELSARFSCCSGACGLGTGGCLAANARDDRFYYPIATDAAAPQFLEGPIGATGLCNNGGVGDAFIASIAANAAPSADFAAAGLNRAVVRADGADGRNHLVRLTYTGPANRGVGRVVHILPPAASWCP